MTDEARDNRPPERRLPEPGYGGWGMSAEQRGGARRRPAAPAAGDGVIPAGSEATTTAAGAEPPAAPLEDQRGDSVDGSEGSATGSRTSG